MSVEISKEAFSLVRYAPLHAPYEDSEPENALLLLIQEHEKSYD